MRNLLVLFVAIIVISNLLEISSAKRIKRDVNDKQNLTNIAEDFVLLHAGKKKILENKVIKPMTKKDNKSLYDAALVALTTKSSNDEVNQRYHENNEQNANEIESVKKPTAANALPYVLRNRDQLPAEKRNDTQGVFSKPSADNSKSYKSLEHPKDRQSIIRNNSAMTKLLPSFGQETANIVGAHVRIPPHYLISSHAFNPFAPIDQMMRFANTLFYKVGNDDDSAENDNSLIEFNSLDSPSPHVFFGSPTIDLVQPSSSHQRQKESLLHSKPSKSKNTSADRKSLDLIDLIENIFQNPEEDQTIHDEIEIFCPLHSGKGTTAHANCQMCKEEVEKVCSCHLIKNDKDASHKDHK